MVKIKVKRVEVSGTQEQRVSDKIIIIFISYYVPLKNLPSSYSSLSFFSNTLHMHILKYTRNNYYYSTITNEQMAKSLKSSFHEWWSTKFLYLVSSNNNRDIDAALSSKMKQWGVKTVFFSSSFFFFLPSSEWGCKEKNLYQIFVVCMN